MAQVVFLPVSVFFSFQLMLVSGILHKTFWARDKGMDNLLPSSVSTSSAVSVHFKGACALLCKRQNDCKSIFYNENNKTCILTSFVYLKMETEVTSSGTRYFTSPAFTPMTCPVSGNTVSNQQSSTCYQLRDDSYNWTTARDSCHTDHGRLAVLDTNDKLDTLVTYLRSANPTGVHHFIGGHRPYTAWNTPWPNGQPDYVWLNGVTVNNYTSPPWYSNEPNSPEGAENVMVIYTTQGNWWLGNYFYYITEKFVCEFAMY